MKISKTLLGGAVLLGMTGLASAQTPVYITGSSAFRASAINEIVLLLNANGGGYTVATDTAGASAIQSSNAITFTGGNVGGVPVTIKASFSGSGAGVQTVAAPAGTFTVPFLPIGATGTNNSNPNTNGNPNDPEVPDIALSDVFQGTTGFIGSFNGVTYSTLKDNTVGVVAFTFAASKGFPASQTMTTQIAQQLFVSGEVPLSFFTGGIGNPTNSTATLVIATGRNADSGTRLTTVAETNIGVNTALFQYKPTVSNGTITDLQPYPALRINGVDKGLGDGGEVSGGSLRAFLTNTVTQNAVNSVDGTFTNGGFLVTYLGVSDFNLVSSSGAVALAYNGIVESQTEIENGAYTLWGYEHLDYKTSLAGAKLSVAKALTTQITNSSSATLSPNVSLTDMKVQRFGDGGVVSPK